MKIEISDKLAIEIFKKKQLEYCIEDVKTRLNEFLEKECSKKFSDAAEKFDESDYESIAQNFLDNYDCNRSDNDQYRDAIKYYFEHLLVL